MSFRIVETKGNKSNSIPAHWDVFLGDSDDSIITVWESQAMAEECVRFLEQYPARRAVSRG